MGMKSKSAKGYQLKTQLPKEKGNQGKAASKLKTCEEITIKNQLADQEPRVCEIRTGFGIRLEIT